MTCLSSSQHNDRPVAWGAVASGVDGDYTIFETLCAFGLFLREVDELACGVHWMQGSGSEDLGVDDVGRGAVLEVGDDVGGGHFGHFGAGGLGGAAEVGDEDGVFAGEEVGVDVGFVFVDVEAGCEDRAGLEGVGEGGFVDDGTAGGVDDAGGGLHGGEVGGGERVGGFGEEWAVDRDEVGFGEQCLFVDEPDAERLGRNRTTMYRSRPRRQRSGEEAAKCRRDAGGTVFLGFFHRL